MSSKLSAQDIQILQALQQDASLSTSELAQRVNLSQSPCWRRINRIEQEGIIERRVAILSREKLGMDVVVFATVNLSAQGRLNLEAFEKEIRNYDEVLECYTMTGSWDYMLKIVTRSVRHYEHFIRETLTLMPFIKEIHSHIAVTEIKNSTALPLSTQLS